MKSRLIFYATGLLAFILLLSCMGDGVDPYHASELRTQQTEALQVLRMFHQRATYSSLTEEQLGQLPDGELLQAAFQKTSARVSATAGRELETLSRLNVSQQTIYVLWLLQSDMQLGGLQQFYFNTSREMAALAPMAFSRIGADQLAGFLQYANECYQDSVDTLLADTTSIASHPFQDCTGSGVEARYRLLWDREEADKRLALFIRRHLRDFTK